MDSADRLFIIHSQPEGDSEGAEPAAADATSASSRSLAKRVRAMLTKIDEQLEEYDRDVGTRMHMIEASPTGKISVDDLEQALRLIKHRPDDEVIEKLVDSECAPSTPMFRYASLLTLAN